MGEVHQPRDFFLRLLGQALYVERRLVGDVAPQLCEQARDSELVAALTKHLEETRTHVEHAERAFRAVEAEPTAMRIAAFEGAVADHEQLAGEASEPTLGDLAHAAAAAQTEHREIAVYSSLIELGRAQGWDDAVKQLERIRKDEQNALKQLEKIAARLARRTAG